jgi:hypothetical protein
VIDRRLTDAINRHVTVEELRCALVEPIGAEERDEVIALVRWFTRRYSSTEARLAYIRHAYERWRPTALPR